MSQEKHIIRELTRLCRLVELASDQPIRAIETMSGGLTNHNYKIIRSDGVAVAARVPGEGTEDYIDRAAEKYNLTLMGTLGIAPQIYYYNENTGALLSEFIQAETMHPENFQNDSMLLAKTATLMRTYHESGLKQANDFTPTEKIRNYEWVLKDSGFKDYFDGIDELCRILTEIETAFAAAPVLKVPCHNDPLSENFLYDGEKLTLIDWEFAGMNHPYFDLAGVIVENQLNDDTTDEFLAYYCGHPPTEAERAPLLINCFLLDAFVCYWALMQLNAGKEEDIYRPYGEERLKRCLTYAAKDNFYAALTKMQNNN